MLTWKRLRASLRHWAIGWRPFDTAPRDGRMLYLANAFNIRLAFWHTGESRWLDYYSCEAREPVRGIRFEPTHWCDLMPNPVRRDERWL